MLNSNASNAVVAKVRAKFSKHLTAKNYQELLACNTVNDVAVYLKNHEGYRRALSDMKEGTIHRGRLESLLERDLMEDFSTLSQFGLSVGAHLGNYMRTRGEIQQLLSFLRYLIAERPEEYIFAMSDFFRKHTPIDLVQLSKARSYDELLVFLNGTEYYSIFEKFSPDNNIKDLDFAGLESALYAHLYKKLFDSINKELHGTEKKEMSNIFKMKIELENIKKIYRMKKYYHMDSDIIRSMLLPYYLYLTPAKLNDLLEIEDCEKIHPLLKETRYKHYLEKICLYQTIDEMNKRVAFLFAKKNMRFSTHASVVLTCYITLKEVELQNIIIIIEGKRYGLPTPEISKMLIGADT